MIPLTELAHNLIREVLRPGDTAIDATAGNGHDTQFLAETVGPDGTVYAFDIQPAAISLTAQRLSAAGFTNCRLILGSHADLQSALPKNLRPIKAVMLNLGYLPGGDKQQTTRIETTLTAIDHGLKLMSHGGIMTILAYTGHDGGADEAAGVEGLLNALPAAHFDVSEPAPAHGRHCAPRLFVVRKSG